MLRITIHEEGSTTRFVVEGKLAEPWVGELRRCWEATERVAKQYAIVDLTGVTLIDSRGKALLTEMHLQGTQLLARGLMTHGIVDDIKNSKR